MILPVEDDYSDILSKAQKGQGISTEALAERCGVSEGAIRAARRGEYEEATAKALAKELGLQPDALRKIAQGKWRPAEVGPMEGVAMACSPFYDWQVNAFLVWERDSRRAIAFDTGTDAQPLLEALQRRGLDLEAVILTHAHRDHVEGLEGLLAPWGEAKVFLGAKEPSIGRAVTPIEEGFRYELGSLAVEGFDTPGHTAGGMSFLVKGLPRRLAIVGDALFAGSMGGAKVSYEQGLESLERLLALPEDTVLAPGHGPLTTVAEEREMNCFARPRGV